MTPAPDPKDPAAEPPASQPAKPVDPDAQEQGAEDHEEGGYA